MRKLIHKLCWYVHKALCCMGIHAPEKIFTLDDELKEFKHDGWFCAVCIKTWGEK